MLKTHLMKKYLNNCTRMNFWKKTRLYLLLVYAVKRILIVLTDLEDIASHRISEVPLWTSKTPTYLYNLASDQKVTTDPMIFKTKFLQIKEQYYTYEEIYTDGSKDGKKVASAAILDGESYQFR